MNLNEIKRRIENQQYLVKSHAISHALKEGFDRLNMVEAVMNGKIIEDYEFEQRVLVWRN